MKLNSIREKACIAIAAAIVLAPMGILQASFADAATKTYSTVLDGVNEVPAAPHNVTGSVRIGIDDSDDSINFLLSVTSNDEKITKAHLHCGTEGVSGPEVVTLFSDADGKTLSGRVASGPITDSSIMPSASGCASVIGFPIRNTGDLTKAIEEGKIYANVHSIAYPEGVARGQLQETTQ